MSLSDAEIMGGIGYGYDQFSYSPVRQEPTGYAYNPISFNTPDSDDDLDKPSQQFDHKNEVDSYFQNQQKKTEPVEKMTNKFNTQNNVMFMFIALILLFIVVAYSQHMQIQHLQNIIGYMLIQHNS